MLFLVHRCLWPLLQYLIALFVLEPPLAFFGFPRVITGFLETSSVGLRFLIGPLPPQ
jgi:hypothetical protein